MSNPQNPSQLPGAPPPIALGGIPTDAPPQFDTFLKADAMQSQFTPEDIDHILGAAGDPAASPAAKASSAQLETEERRKIVEAAEVMYMRRARASLAGVTQAMQRPGNPFFLPNCPEGKSSDRCPLARRLGFRVHYLWDNATDQVMFSMRLSGGLGQPRYYIVQGAPPVASLQDRTISPYDRHMLAVNATKTLVFELGLSPEAIVDTALNRVTIGQNTLVYCRLDEFDAWWQSQRQADRDNRKARRDAYIDGLEEAGATRYLTPFVATLGEIADRKAHANREGRSFIGQVGGFRR